MAGKNAKRAGRKKQSVDGRKSGDRSQKSAERKAKAKAKSKITSKPKTKKKPHRRAQPRRRAEPSTPLLPGESALQQRTLPQGRRFVEFPLVKGKVADKIELFTSGENHEITIDFQDRTSLSLNIQPGFTINAELLRHGEWEPEILAEWPPIHSSRE